MAGTRSSVKNDKQYAVRLRPAPVWFHYWSVSELDLVAGTVAALLVLLVRLAR